MLSADEIRVLVAGEPNPIPLTVRAGDYDKAMVSIVRAVEHAAYECAARVCEPKGPRPCDCTSCDCGNYGDAQRVAQWDEATARAADIRSLMEQPK